MDTITVFTQVVPALVYYAFFAPNEEVVPTTTEDACEITPTWPGSTTHPASHVPPTTSSDLSTTMTAPTEQLPTQVFSVELDESIDVQIEVVTSIVLLGRSFTNETSAVVQFDNNKYVRKQNNPDSPHMRDLVEFLPEEDKHLFCFPVYTTNDDDYFPYFDEARDGFQDIDNITFSNLGNVLSAIAVMHRFDFVHRDIKCENFIKLPNNSTMLIDFGDMLPSDTPTTPFYGSTRAYLSPEYISGGYVPLKETDVWAATVMVFTLLTGNTVLLNETTNNILSSTLLDDLRNQAAMRIATTTPVANCTKRPINAVVRLRALFDSYRTTMGDFIKTQGIMYGDLVDASAKETVHITALFDLINHGFSLVPSDRPTMDEFSTKFSAIATKLGPDRITWPYSTR